MILLADIRRSPHPHRAIALALPRLAFWGIAHGYVRWRWVSVGAVTLIIAASALYVVTVNALLLHGEAMRRAVGALAELERERAALEEQFLQRRSPSWLAATARSRGMVEASGVRYLTPPSPVALSH